MHDRRSYRRRDANHRCAEPTGFDIRPQENEDRTDETKLQQDKGEWVEWVKHDKLQVGDAIQLSKPALSQNPDILLPDGVRGIVRHVDSDEDAMVFFPKAPYHKFGEHWIRRSDSKMLVRRTSEQQAKIS
eukprot:gnl/MRDRNA2_/MRDRNA2_202530_c0_seq1.p1 gnl/MRDRNA2_/MRDRNA2_202530_c0~~gnl/MRDRNA2_/MRDRNA2_202530_c0_seq1.p1  ORF type:complete len:130 (-),score=25.25 gnl/MRDRNA2_/MRDRNA2_202530_c0_seq1:58-447(-)